MAFVVLLFSLYLYKPEASLLHNICIFIAQYCQLSAQRNL